MNKRLLLLVVLLVVSTSALFGQVASMIQSEWNTISPWNGTCPRIGYTSADAGTGALSVAKIMKYWNYPNQGVGSVSYVDDDLGQINQSLVQSFNWERMANNLYRQETGVLIRTVAYGIKSDWELDYTTADIQDVMASMLANFSYSSSMEYHDLANTSFYQWRQMINEQLSLGRPVLYQGYAEDVDRNYFIVIDGLTVDNRYTYVTSLGTYEHYTTNLTDLNIDGHAISANNQKMLINIIPQNIEEYDESFEDGFTNNNWYFQGNAGWTIASNEAYAGTHSARPQNIAHNQSSSILIDLSVPVADNISFFIKPSCETPTEGQCDKAVFYINGVEQDEWNGIGDWTFASYALQPGTYQFKWSYIKDGSVVHGDDTVYLDAITLPSGETPLNPPRNLTAVNNTGNTVVLNWDYPEGYQRDLQGYKIYKDGSELAQSFSPGVTTYTNGNVANGLHNYAVKAIYNSGLSDYSNTAFVEIQIIYSPTNVRYTIPSVGTAWVRWDVSPLVGTYTPDSYKLYLNNEWYSDSVQNEIMLPLEEGAHLFYVTAVYDGIESPPSTVLNIVMGTLPPPTNLTATVYAGNSVHIEWTRPVTPLITGYEIYRNNQLLTSINNQTTTLYNDEDLPNGNYVYTMKTVNGNETSGPSLGASVLIMNLESPINVQSTIVNEVSVQLTWSYPSMANLLEQYKVYRNGVVVASVYNTLNPSFFDYNLANGSYDYQITAFYNGVESELSETENVVIDYPYPPRNFVATVNGSNVQLSWSVPATQGGASRAIQTYKIYKDGEIIHTINNTSTTSYTVRGVENGTYTFAIAAEYGSGMSILVEAQVTVEVFYAPQNLAYSIDGQNVTITWEAGSLSRDLLQYHLYRNGTEHATITEPTYEDMNLINGHYEYSVVAEYSSGLSEPSETISFDLEIPYPVVNLYYEIEDNNITITWERPSDGSAERSLVSYELFRDGVSLATTTALTHTDYNLINGSYDYYIVVHYTNESSQPSNPISVELIKQYPVENLAWLVQNRNNIVLTWNVNSYSGESIENFRVLRNDALLTITNELTYSNLGLEDGAYTFSIIAVYSNGLAEAVTGETIQIEYPFPVSELATTVAEDNISLTWAYQTTDSTVFKIFRNSMFIGQTTDLNYSDEGLANGFYAYHIITANNSDSGDSIASATVSAEVSVTYPVTGLVANVVEDSINLTWNVPAVSTRALASYKVFVNDELYQENINATNYTLTQLSNGAYAIFVVATYTNGDSVPSNLVNAVVEVKYTPVNFAIITFGNNVELNWEAPTDATGILNYNIYRNNEVIAQVVNPTYTDSDLANNNYSYAITTNYNSGESAPTATETTLIEFLYIVTNLTAQIVNADFSVTWETNPLAGASIVEYQIFRDGVLVTTTENANYQSVSNANGTYETAVKAVYASGVSELSEAVTTVIDVHYPVNNIAYSIEDSNVTLTWQAHDYANNVIEYIVYRDNAELAIISELSYTDTNLSNGNYGYQVKAIYPNGESDISNMVRVTVELLYAPNNLTFNVVSDSITLNWDEPNAMYRGFIGYKLFKDEELLASLTELTYTDGGLTNGDYTYSVKAEYSSGDSEASNAVTANVEVLYPAVNLALDIEADDATLTWETNLMSGASIIDFTIYRDGESIGNIAELTYLDEALANGVYAYSVAVNYLTGSSPLAQAVSGLVEVLYPPQNLNCLVEANNVLITWDVAPTSATRSFLGYRLYRDNEEIFFNETATTYNDLNLINNSYEYKLEAEYSTGISEALTALVNIEVLYPVENFTGSLTDTEINLAWENNPLAGNSIISYSLIRNSELYATLTELSYLDSALANGVYEYRVVANYNNGSALPSDDLTFNLEITYPATNLTAQVTANVVDLVWDLPANSPRALLSYNIYRDGVIVGNTEELNYSDTALTNAIYSYYVTAEYTSGESDPSNSVEAIVEVLYAPNNLTFNVVSDSITLNWDEPNAMYRGFIGYKLFRDEELLASQTELTYTDVGLTNGDYTYSVKAEYSSGDSEASNAVTVNLEVLYPANNLTGTLNIDEVTLAWDTPSELYRSFLGYNVYRNNELINSTLETSFVDSYLVNGSHTYYIKANYTTGESTPTNSVDFFVEITYPVTSLSATVDENNVTLTWDIPAVSAQTRAFRGYFIYRNNAIATVIENPATTSWIDNSLANGDYEYYLKAVYDAGISVESNHVTVNIEILPDLFAPTNLLLFVENERDVHLTWDIPSAEATNYLIFKDNLEIATSNNNSYWDNDLPNGSYHYHVKAVYPEGISSPSNIVVANIATTDTPNNLATAITNGNDVVLTWETPNNGETAFIINRNGEELTYLSDVAQVEYIDQGLTNALYTYTIRAVYNHQFSELSNPAYADVMKLYTPQISYYQAIDNYISFTWEDLTPWGRLVDYTVYKNGEEVTNTTVSSYTEADLTNGNYDFTVSANFDFGSSEQSAPVSFDILMPQMVTNVATTITNNDLVLSWDYPIDTGLISAYKVYKDGVVIATTQDNSFTDVDLVNGNYSYQVMTYYNDTIDNPITEALVVAYINAYPITNLSTDIVGQDIVLIWDAPLDMYGFIHYEVSRNAEFVMNILGTENEYVDIAPENGLYQYTIKSVYQNNAEVEVVSESINFIIPVSPTNLAISAEETVSLTWDFTGTDYGFTGFEVYNNEELLTTTTATTYELDLDNGNYNFKISTSYGPVASEYSDVLSYELVKTYPVLNATAELTSTVILNSPGTLLPTLIA